MCKKKILYIITKSNYGGAQRYIYDLATSVSKRSYCVTVAFGGTGKKNESVGALQKKLNEKNIKTIVIKNFMRDISFISDFLAFIEIIKIIKKEKPDVLHVTSSKAGGLGAFAGRLLRIEKIIFTSHGLAYDENWRPFWQRSLIYMATWLTIVLSTKTIQINKDTYKRSKKMPFVKEKIKLIYNGINKPYFLQRNDAREYLYKKGNIPNEFWVGTIAELTKNKNLNVLVNSMSLLRKDNSDIHLFIIGEGEERKNLEKIIKEKKLKKNVHLLGYINNASKFLKAFDIFTLPSKKEGLPYVLLEAGCAKLPVIVSNINGTTDIIKNKKNGIAIDINQNEIAKQILKMYKNKNMADKYGKELKEYVNKMFSIKKMTEETITLY